MSLAVGHQIQNVEYAGVFNEGKEEVLQTTALTTGPVLVTGQSIVRYPNGSPLNGDLTIASKSQVTASGHIISAGVSSVLVARSVYTFSTSTGAILSHQPFKL